MWLKKVFPQNRKMTHQYNLEQNTNFSYAWPRLQKERKNVRELIPVISYKNFLGFFVERALKEIINHSLKLAKVFLQ